MFSPSASSFDSNKEASLSLSPMLKKHVTSRGQRPTRRRKSSNSFAIPVPATATKTPNKMTIHANESTSRMPFSPLTNSIDRRVRKNSHNESHNNDGDSEKLSSSSAFSSIVPPKTKRVIDFGYAATKRSRTSTNEVKSQSNSLTCPERSPVDVDTSTCIDTNTKENMHLGEDKDSVHLMQEGQYLEKSREAENLEEYEIEFPVHCKPSSATLQSAYSQALKYGTHQNHLHSVNCNQLSFTEVIVPSIFQAFNDELKQMEGKAKGRSATNVVKKIRTYRCFLKACEEEMVVAAKDARELRMLELIKKTKETLYLEQKRKEEDKRQKKAALQQKRQQERERVRQLKEKKKLQKKKDFQKNRGLWKELASSMKELLLIEKEEKMWREADLSGFTCEIGEDGCNDKDTEIITSDELQRPTELQFILEGITTSANRIHEALQDLPTLMTQSEVVRGELYQEYKENHKFDGYRAHKNPKALIRALTLE